MTNEEYSRRIQAAIDLLEKAKARVDKGFFETGMNYVRDGKRVLNNIIKDSNKE